MAITLQGDALSTYSNDIRASNLTDGTSTKSMTQVLNGVGNLSRATVFRLSANFATNNDIVGNWETPDQTNGEAGNITAAADGVTQNGGVFTFPNTGFWLVQFTGQVQIGANTGCFINTQMTQNAQDFVTIASAVAANQSVANANGSTTSTCMVDITATNTHQVRFMTSGFSGATGLLGNTALNFTTALFLRIGDT